MKPIYSLAEASRAAEARVAEFSGLYRIVLVVEAAVALALLIVPGWTADVFGLPETVEPAIAAVFLLWAVAFQLPGLMNPVHSRLPVVIGVAGRYGIGIALLSQGIWLFAVITLAFALALNIVYHRMVRTVLMSRP